jgi:hypothetical protein
MRMPPSTGIPDSEKNQIKEMEKMRNKNWRNEAACRGVDIAIFYQGRGSGPRMYDKAREYCNQCPVLADCFEFIMEIELDPHNHRCGMFAGLTPKQRAAYQAQRDTNVSAS